MRLPLALLLAFALSDVAAGADNITNLYVGQALAVGMALTTTPSVEATNVPASIAVQPQSIAVETNSNASFTVTATGTAPLAYQWRLGGTPIAGATSTAGVYATNNVVSEANGNQYDCVVTNAYGSATSSVATLTVTNGVGGGSFSTPADYSPLAWYSPEQTYCTNNLGGNVTDGSTLGFVADKSGNTNTLASRFGGVQWTATSASGNPFFQMSAAKDQVEIAALSQGTIAQPLTIYCVLSNSVVGNVTVPWEAYRAYNYALILNANSTMSANSGSSFTTTNAVADGWHILTVVFDGANSSIRVDGAQAATGDVGAASLVGFSFGSDEGDGDYRWRGGIGDMIICSGHHNATYLSNVEGWLKSRWSTP